MQVLITGCYRTGSEWLTQLMNNHPELTATMYVVSFMRFCYRRYDPLDDPANYSRLLFQAAARIWQRWGRRLPVYRILEACAAQPEVTYAFLYDRMMRELFLEGGEGHWAEKTQLVWSRVPDFLEMFPQGKAVMILRDPRSVLASFKRYTYAPPPAYLGAVFNSLGAMQAAADYQRRWGGSRFLALRYEDLVADTAGQMRRVFAFLGLSAEYDLTTPRDWRDPRGRPWEHNSAFLPPQASARQFDPQAAVRRWQEHLEPWEVGLCEAVCGPAMRAWGYQPSGADPRWPTALGHLLADANLTRFLRRWASEGRGVEEFPTDPLRPENWEENARAPSTPAAAAGGD